MKSRNLCRLGPGICDKKVYPKIRQSTSVTEWVSEWLNHRVASLSHLMPEKSLQNLQKMWSNLLAGKDQNISKHSKKLKQDRLELHVQIIKFLEDPTSGWPVSQTANLAQVQVLALVMSWGSWTQGMRVPNTGVNRGFLQNSLQPSGQSSACHRLERSDKGNKESLVVTSNMKHLKEGS